MFGKLITERKARLQSRTKLREELKDYKVWQRKFKKAMRSVNYSKVDQLVDIAVYYGYEIPGVEKNYILRTMRDKYIKLQEVQKSRKEGE